MNRISVRFGWGLGVGLRKRFNRLGRKYLRGPNRRFRSIFLRYVYERRKVQWLRDHPSSLAAQNRQNSAVRFGTVYSSSISFDFVISAISLTRIDRMNWNSFHTLVVCAEEIFDRDWIRCSRISFRRRLNRRIPMVRISVEFLTHLILHVSANKYLIVSLYLLATLWILQL